MKKYVYLLSLLFVSFITVAQDEGEIVKRERLEKSSGVFVGLGPSFTLGKNIGDYSVGFNFEGGYLKRLNRVLSIGPSISYLSFEYDPEKTGYNNVFVDNTEYFDDNSGYYYISGMYVDFKGGNLELLSLALNVKLNLVPVMDNSKISVYAFAKPFITSFTRQEVKGDAWVFPIYDFNDDTEYDEAEAVESVQYGASVPWEAGDPTWASYGVEISEDLKKDTRITGGIFIGPGIEIMPAKKVSFYLQAAFGYTFPVSFVSTESYYADGTFDEVTEKYPIVEEGFPSVNIQAGVSFNF